MGGREVDSSLGKDVEYEFNYNPELLFPIRRQEGRDRVGIDSQHLPFEGIDIWTGFEISWLNAKGKPVVRVAEFTLPSNTPNLIESKSFKLYLNSFNQTVFESEQKAVEAMQRDLSEAAGGKVGVALYPVDSEHLNCSQLTGECVDELDVSVDVYEPDPGLLVSDADEQVSEVLYSHLLRSNCPVTGQPDWGTLVVHYTGNKLDREAFLKYVISFRQHTGFHEQCVEQAFVDIKKATNAKELVVYARYLRRGGLDINPYRSMNGPLPSECLQHRFHRQ
ncbi:NADPH-dependent 7-cyano-7-deazaguanine reductase QueF [Litoribrevibacter albus]|uniref:NADPH-dependent 7-cyano-7-deazaguanine reductase n=1 Tax=Litoribrevibacter albus TaxID=1473156 RepID=A0AA37W8D2_9GAMM|nr:NADPH-dependent 7-cyano-7-deazaguanine reductase QueF [Litoribrevibacter albus]GLQ32293.1 NADPH-dependent 7-cyano-7-deazaguanine reductase [Litoribrevibacter albus]